jgi:hypothetical protein
METDPEGTPAMSIAQLQPSARTTSAARKSALRARAISTREALRRHPWALDVEGEDFEPVPDYEGPEYGQRRGLVGAYHAGIDFSDSAQVARLVNVYLDVINGWGRQPTGEPYPGALALIKSLRRDGVSR